MPAKVIPMKKIIFPVLLSALVVPGAGQIYNKEKGKGIVLMSLFFLVILGFMVSVTVSLSAVIPRPWSFRPNRCGYWRKMFWRRKAGLSPLSGI
jgi:hypothetical protein